MGKVSIAPLQMSILQQNDQRLPSVSRFPVDEREALAAFLGAFPEAINLAVTNPPLAVALANISRGGTFALARGDREFVGNLLHQRRRRICGALGFPASERVVQILAKVQPEACRLYLLAAVRRSFRNSALLSILSHLPAIGLTELRLTTQLENCPRISAALFVDLAAKLADETESNFWRVLRQTDTLLRLRDREWRMFRSVEQMRRCYYRLWHGLADLERFDSEGENAGATQFPFPAAPLSGIDEIQPIDSAAALIEEARAMGHCILSYAERVMEGETYLYRVMSTERATLSIMFHGTIWQIDQLGGVQNQRVSVATEELIESWLRNTQTSIGH